MDLHQHIRMQLVNSLERSPADAATLNDALRLLSKWRCVLIQNTFLQRYGTRVLQGPLRGLEFVTESAEGSHVPKLIGCYEQPLQPFIEAAMRRDYSLFINIGAAEGYYAVGMARSMPATRVLACDTNPKAQHVCAELAKKNGVSDRVSIRGAFAGTDFAAYADRRTLVLCDIEGAEKELLDPVAAPALAGMDLIVEAHELFVPGVTQSLVDRFAPTHEITRVDDDGQRKLEVPEWFNRLAHLDQLLAIWEWRSGPTPWLVMNARIPAGIG